MVYGSTGKPKKRHIQGFTSENSTAFPVETKYAFIFSVKPVPANTTSPGIGHAPISLIIAGIFSSAVPPTD
jgi:hypothetical protein